MYRFSQCNTENTSTRGIRGTQACVMALSIPSQAAWLKFGNLAAKSEQPCVACLLGIRDAAPGGRRGADPPAGFRKSFGGPETSFMNATRNFNRFVCHRADYRAANALRGKRAVQHKMLQMRHKCRRAFPEITLGILVILGRPAAPLAIRIIENLGKNFNTEK